MAHEITENCLGCGMCVADCPVGAIVSHYSDVFYIDEQTCTDCGHCIYGCPVDAIMQN